ncbi:MAG: 23S rRNA (adenine(2503)-C(2))-methyltransferase RlmN [Phycisphaeraceae bacterium]
MQSPPTTAPHIFGLTRDELQAHLASLGMPRFRTDQILNWVYQRGVADPQQMTDLSKADRERLAAHLTFTTLAPLRHQSATDGTQKLLLQVPPVGRGLPVKPEIPDDPNALIPGATECVMIPAENPTGAVRRTACISSQIGCPVGCRFCASGLGGLEQNLTAGQIVEQIWQLNQLPGLAGERGISNVVFMGMGEPLTNFDNVTRAIRIMTAPWAFDLSARRVTLSTVGLPAQIRRLADQLELPITLAISLHAPNDTLRREIIPWAERTSVADLVAAARYYFEKTGREVTIEYILLRQVNDQPEHARQLAAIARHMRCHVNLIRYNEVKGLPYGRPASEDVRQFQQILRKAGVNSHIRASRGRDIAAACGQLRHESKKPAAPPTA